jgi:hypothetical protein
MTTPLRPGPRLGALLIGPLLLLSTARCTQPVYGPERLTAEQVAAIVQSYYHTSGPLSDSLRDDRPVPIYAPDPQDAWNRLHHLLFSRSTRWAMSPYFREGLTASLEAKLAKAADDDTRRSALMEFGFPHEPGVALTVERRVGGDAPDFFLYHDVHFLLQDDRRFSALEHLLNEADTHEFLEGRSIMARVLLQQDLWNRFDELDSLVRLEKDAQVRAKAQRLEALLGRAIARVACRQQDLARVPSNLAAIARAHQTIDPDLLSDGSDWREIVPRTSSSPAQTTAHAHNAGYRRLFRAFLRIPPQAGGAQCLEDYFRQYDEPGLSLREFPCFPSNLLAPASRALLVETLLALTRNGEILPLPLIFSIQMREIRPFLPGPDGRLTLDDIPFFLYHGSRLLFVRSGAEGGGLVALPADAPVPASVSAFESGAGQPLVPARVSCSRSCHGPTGQYLMTTAFHGIKGVSVLRPGNTLQQEAVIRAKQERDDYRNLRRYFPG